MTAVFIISLFLLLIIVLVRSSVKRKKQKQMFEPLLRKLKDRGFIESSSNKLTYELNGFASWIYWLYKREEIDLEIGVDSEIEFMKEGLVQRNKKSLDFLKRNKNDGFYIANPKGAIAKTFKIKNESEMPSTETVFKTIESIIELTKKEKNDHLTRS